jgi:zinc/manganese transport system substrate-binding protein
MTQMIGSHNQRKTYAPTRRGTNLRRLVIGMAVLLMGACAAPPAAAPSNLPTPNTAPTQAAPPTAMPTVELAPTAAPTEAIAATFAAPTVAPSPTPNAAKLKVVATFSVLGDFVRAIAGNNVALTTMVGPDSDTHEFEPAPSDSVKLADADVIIENGLGFEAWLDNLYIASGSKAVRIVTSAGIAPREVDANGQKEADPHIWQNPLNAIQMVKNIEAALSKADVVHADAYRKNAVAYIKQLQGLDAEISAEVDRLNKDQRKIVTSHDALGYFAERYGFEVIGSVIQSLSTEAGEPSAQDLAALADHIQATGSKAIFLESMANPTLIENVASEAGVEVGPQLYTDALGAKGSAGATYLEAMRHNAQAIVGALR